MPSAFSPSTAGGKARFLHTLMTRGTGLPGDQRLTEEALGRSRIPLGGGQKLDRLTSRIHCPVQIFVLAFDLYIGFVCAVAFVRRLQMWAAGLVPLGCVVDEMVNRRSDDSAVQVFIGQDAREQCERSPIGNEGEHCLTRACARRSWRPE